MAKDKQIFIVTSGQYDDYRIEAVFEDENEAKAFAYDNREFVVESETISSHEDSLIHLWEYDGENISESDIHKSKIYDLNLLSDGNKVTIEDRKVTKSYSIVNKEHAIDWFNKMQEHLNKNPEEGTRVYIMSGLIEYING